MPTETVEDHCQVKRSTHTHTHTSTSLSLPRSVFLQIPTIIVLAHFSSFGLLFGWWFLRQNDDYINGDGKQHLNFRRISLTVLRLIFSHPDPKDTTKQHSHSRGSMGVFVNL